ncbi:hypothetical protein THAOC_19390, partial [Thalassiosira oceanica]
MDVGVVGVIFKFSVITRSHFSIGVAYPSMDDGQGRSPAAQKKRKGVGQRTGEDRQGCPPPTARGGAGVLLIVVVLALQLAIYWPAFVRPAHPPPAAGAPGGAGGRNIAPGSTSVAAKRHSPASGRGGRQRADGPFDEEQDDDAISSALARDASTPRTSHGLPAGAANGSA